MTIRPRLEYNKCIYYRASPGTKLLASLKPTTEPSNAVCKPVPVRSPCRPQTFLSRAVTSGRDIHFNYLGWSAWEEN